jgi:hypothetical protein
MASPSGKARGTDLMREIPDWTRHEREAKRFRTLSERSRNPEMKAVLARMAEMHERTAEGLKASSQQPLARPLQNEASGSAKGPLKAYRLRLFTPGASETTVPINSEADGHALQVAWLVHDSCKEVYSGFELWQGDRCIVKSWDRRTVKRPAAPREIEDSIQQSVIETEQRVFDSQMTIRESSALLKTTERLLRASGRFPTAAAE